MIAINFNFYFTIYNIPFTVWIFTIHEVLIRKSINLNIRISFQGGLKMNWLTNKPFQIYLIKK